MSTTLDRGDIAFTSIRSDDGDSFSFVPFVDIAAGTQIIFTDNGWLENGTLRSGEGSVTWTAPAAGVAAGTVVVLTNAAGGNWPAAEGGSGSFNLSASGDQVIAYQGTLGAPERLLAAVSLNAFLTTTGVTPTSNQSYVPGTGTAAAGDDLTPGAYAVQLRDTAAEVDNGTYTGITVGTVEELLAAINDPANWNTNNDPALLPAPPVTFTIEGAGGTTAFVSIGDVAAAEGNAGGTVFTFTVTRSDNAGAFTLDYATADGTATTADNDYVSTGGTLEFTAGGDLSLTISVTVNGDAVAEANETFFVNLTNLASTLGTAAFADAQGTGTITNDDIVFTEIAAIQGAGHRSPLATTLTGSPTGTNNIAQSANSGSNRYNVEGVVTAITTNGFWIQDATPDADANTSDGIFVFTGTPTFPALTSAPAGLAVGETARILGAQVSEFRAATNNLTVTQLSATVAGASIVDLGGSTIIAPVVIGGPGGLLPPTGGVEDDGFTSFDPATDAADFWESLEGMLVEIANPVTTSITSEFRTRDPADSANAEGPPNEEIWVLAEGTYDPASLTPRGAPLLGPTDVNPERIQIDDLTPGVDFPSVSVGAVLASVTGVVNYDFQNYEVLTTGVTVVTPSTLTDETTAIAADSRQLTIASYNVENLDPEVEDTAAGSVAGGDLYTRLGNSDDDIGSGKFAAHARQIAVNLGAPVIVALQEVQDNDGAEISSEVDATETLQTLVDLIFANHGILYAFAFENPPTSNVDGGQPNANIRPAFLYRPDIVTLVGTTRIEDPNPGEADGFAGDDFASSRKPLEGIFTFNGQTVTVINNHWNSKGGDNAVFGNVQPPVLGSEAQRIEQAKIVNARVDDLLAADANANVVVLGDLNDFAWSNPNRTLEGTLGGGTRVLTDLAEALLPADERYSYSFQGNAQSLDHTLVSDALLNTTSPQFDIVHVNADLATGVSDHDPSVALFDFRELAELLVFGAGADTEEGFGGADTMVGGTGNDSLDGGDGDDIVDGGAGADTMAGGEGNDLFLVNEAGDRVSETSGADTVIASVDYTLGAGIEDGLLSDGAAIRLRGNALDNALTGNSTRNRVDAGGGADSVDGLDGNDSLFGQDGDDLLRGGAGRDDLYGDAGADTLDGGEGGDLLVGGAGADMFLFAATPLTANGDNVNGYTAGEDVIAILAAAFDPALGLGALDPARFEANAAGQASVAGTGILVFETDLRWLWWDNDGAGAGRELVARFGAAVTIGAADIVVV